MRGALVLISHDRRFLSALSKTTIWLDRGVTRRIEQGFSAFEAWRDAFFEEEERDRHKLDRKIADEEHWLRYGVTARRKRNVRRLGNLHALRKERREDRRPVGTATMTSTEAESSGALVIEAKGAAKAYGARTIVGDLSIRVMRGDRLGIVGANGAGKTTLINLLTGQLAPDSGTVALGTNLKMMLLDQARAVLEPTMTVTEVLTGGSGDTVDRRRRQPPRRRLPQGLPVRARAGPHPGAACSPAASATACSSPAPWRSPPTSSSSTSRPTTSTSRPSTSCRRCWRDYSGTLILVSHDRDFLDRVVGSVLVSEGEGRWVEYAGGYTDMIAQRGEGVQARAAAGRAEQGGGPARDAKDRAKAGRSGSAGRQAQARLQGPARAEDPAGADEEARIRHRQAARGAGRSAASTPATRPASPRPRICSASPRPNWPRPRTAGSNWRCCATLEPARATRGRRRGLHDAVNGV